MNEEEKKEIKIVNSLKEWGKIHFIVKDRSHARLTYNEVYLLLNLIEKLQKENEELKTELERQKDINRVINQKGLEKEYEKALEKTMIKFLKNNIDKDFIPVQKVKDKIEEIINNREYRIVFEGDAEFPDDATIIEAQKYIKLDKLQELIEESEEK